MINKNKIFNPIGLKWVEKELDKTYCNHLENTIWILYLGNIKLGHIEINRYDIVKYEFHTNYDDSLYDERELSYHECGFVCISDHLNQCKSIVEDYILELLFTDRKYIS